MDRYPYINTLLLVLILIFVVLMFFGVGVVPGGKAF